MPPISRPFQILLVVFAVFVAAYGAYFLVLRGPSSSTSSTTVSEPVATTAAPALRVHSSKAPQVGKVYHGSAPGLEGLTRDVAKARGAVGAAQQSGEHELNEAGAAGTGVPASTGANATPTHAPVTQGSHRVGVTPAASVPAPSHAKATTTTEALSGPDHVPARQALVEHALKQGKVAVILFWNPQGADDVADQNELRLLEAVHHQITAVANRVPVVRAEIKRSGLELEKPFAAFEASASEVTSFGSITRGVQVYGTPTLLVINPKGHAITITGLTDAFAIEQAIDEARNS